MRVYYFGIYNSGGGLENFAKNLIGKVTQKDPSIGFTILATDKSISFSDFFLSVGCEIVILPNPHKHPLGFYRALLAILKSATSDDVVQLNICSFRNPLLFLACKVSRVKTIIVGHYTKVDDGKVPFIHSINRELFKNMAVNVTNSQDVTAFMFPNTRSLFIANGIDLDRFSFSLESRKAIREKLGYNDDDILIGQIGRISPEKNQLFSVQIIYELMKKNKNYKLCFVGNEFDKRPREAMENLHLQNAIQFIGPVYQGIEKYYSAFDFCLLPSKNEGMSLSFLESLASSVCALYSAAVPKTEYNKTADNYFDLDTRLWVEAIEEMVEISAYKNRNHECILKNTDYDLDVFADKYIELYRNYENIKLNQGSID